MWREVTMVWGKKKTKLEEQDYFWGNCLYWKLTSPAATAKSKFERKYLKHKLSSAIRTHTSPRCNNSLSSTQLHLCGGQQNQQIFFIIQTPRSGGNEEEYRFIFTFTFKGIWVEEYEKRVGSSAFADNANTPYVSFQTQAFQMLVAQQSWAPEGHTWNPGSL